jgi:Bacterial SH3 domain
MPPKAAAAACLVVLASVPAQGEDAIASLGKERAAASHLEWEIREAGHPVLGPIRFAHTKMPVVTPVGGANIFSNAYVSCEKNARTLAIELTNQTAPDDPGGLEPATLPRLVCIAPAASGDTRLVQQMLEATWQLNEVGDAMARGFRPAALRACAAIGVVQEVALPEGWARPRERVQFEIDPYGRALDEIFATCGEVSAYASAAPFSPARGKSDEGSAWKTARTVASGATNVRAGPSLHSAVVARLDPGAVILVQSTGGAWWRARARSGRKFEGYIREDRLVIR